MLGASYVGATANCPLGGITTITNTPNTKVMCERGMIATSGSTGVCSFHTTFSVLGSSRVTIMGLPIVRVGDVTTCGGVVLEGSGKVIVG